jgi:cyclase
MKQSLRFPRVLIRFFPCIVLSCLLPAGTVRPGQTGSGAAASQPLPGETMTVQAVRGREGIYMIKGGSGANTGFFIGKSEVIVIDSKMTVSSARQAIDEIRKLTSKPIRKILLTHSDRDHVDGLPAFPAGASIISHEETRRFMDEAFKGDTLRAFLPDITFASRASVYSDSSRIDLFHFGPAHTAGDAVILFPREKVAFTGDLVTVGRDPLIHLAKNGTSFGLVKVLKAILRLDADVYVTGHSDLAGRPEVEAEIRGIEEKQTRVRELVKAGKTLDEVKKAFGVADGGRWPSLAEVIYREVTEKESP